jgi:hypothetical protein
LKNKLNADLLEMGLNSASKRGVFSPNFSS